MSAGIDRSFRVALVSMPPAGAHYPSLQLAALKAYLDRMPRPVPVDAFELNLLFCKRVGYEAYRAFTMSRYYADYIFSRFVFDDTVAEAALGSRSDILDVAPPDVAVHAEAAWRFLQEAVRTVEWGRYDLVGFTLTHMQVGSSLALARRIKAVHPNTRIVLGGIHCFGDLGKSFLECFDFVDYVVDGEGEETLAQLVAALRDGRQSAVPGCRHRRLDGTIADQPRVDSLDMDSLPIPDFTHYFQQARTLGLALPDIRLPIEGARGCWWNRCTYCAINIQYPVYRRKSNARLVSEIDHLVGKHEVLAVHLADSIQPDAEIGDLTRRLRETGRDIRLHMEIRASITREELAALRRAGLRFVQVGIEAFSTAALRRMRKGTSLLQNVQVMKWCHELGICNWYNLIANYPGQTCEEVEEQIRVCRKLVHLEPPGSISKFKLNYGSPAYRRKARDTRWKTEHLCLPADMGGELLVFEAGLPKPPDGPWKELEEIIGRWRARWSRVTMLLYYQDGGDFLIIEDRRGPDRALQHRLDETQRQLYLLCDSTRRFDEICALFGDGHRDDVRAVLQEFVDHGLMLEEGDTYLSLAPNGSNHLIPG